jgi:SAM-dependent methyltransferase
MGVLERLPTSTERFYADGYYGGEQTGNDTCGTHYANYDLTAEHTLLWARLMVEAMLPRGGRILDVGCANGFLLRRLNGRFQRFGIEVNAKAAAEAAANGVTIISSDVADPRVMGCEPFHSITALAVLEHVLDIRAAVAVCLDLLTPRGFLLYEVPLMSEVADNKDWVNGSYEHIYYPTTGGLEALFGSFPGVSHAGFETDIKGFSASYIGLATRDFDTFDRGKHLLDVMTQPTLAELGLMERRLNLAYHLVHGFRPTPERILALPELLETASSPGLLKRLMELWSIDCASARV